MPPEIRPNVRTVFFIGITLLRRDISHPPAAASSSFRVISRFRAKNHPKM
jgi:hypothetical protein